MSTGKACVCVHAAARLGILLVEFALDQRPHPGSAVTHRPILALLVLLTSWPATAFGFCRTNTCQTDNNCEVDERGCPVGGRPVRWPNGCLSFAVQRDGSELQGFDADVVLEIAQKAFALWTDSECFGGGSPPLTFGAQGRVRCNVPEYNCDPGDWNANVVMFRDEGWPHVASALAVTCVTMNVDTGVILDADIEINTTPPYFDFALPGENAGADLQTVITHEAGHFLGLEHSNLSGALMFANYNDSVLVSSLSDDDIAGVCEIYGARETDPSCETPELPESTACAGGSECVARQGPQGCSCRLAALAHSREQRGHVAALLGLGVCSWGLRRRGRRKRRSWLRQGTQASKS